MVDIKTFECPNCGGSIFDATKPCRFCGSKTIIVDDKIKFALAGIICPKCGSNNKDRNRFCDKCGLNFYKKCPKCNKEINLESSYCSNCGVDINEEIEKKCIAVQEQKERDIRSKLEEKINKEKSRAKRIKLYIMIIVGGLLVYMVRDWLRFH